MERQVILTLVLAIPVALILAVFIWYINISGIYAAIKEAQTWKTALFYTFTLTAWLTVENYLSFNQFEDILISPWMKTSYWL